MLQKPQQSRKLELASNLSFNMKLSSGRNRLRFKIFSKRTHQVTLVALGGSKAMHEFLVLHYLATDSAREWDQLPASVHMGTCRFSAGACPTHVRQLPHCPFPQTVCPPFLDCGNEVMLDLLLGARKHRYLRKSLVDPRPAQVYVRGFSAGSYSGICLLHLLPAGLSSSEI